MQRVGGVSRCVVELVKAIGYSDALWTLYAGPHCNEYLMSSEYTVSGRHVVGKLERRPLGRISGSLRVEGKFARAVASEPHGIIHRTYYPALDRSSASTPVVVTLHDMMWERLQTRASLSESLNSRIKKSALTRADRIACVSEFTRSELDVVWPMLSYKSEVIHHGVRPLSLSPILPVRDRPFFLFVGSREYRKRFSVIAEALSISRRLDHDLVCVGGGHFSGNEEQKLKSLGLCGRVEQVDAPDKLLAGFYAGATALLYPSAYEGFGMPILEAMAHSCPVIAASSSSLREVGGDAALYAPVDDVEAWRSQMEAMSSSTSTAASMRIAGVQRANHFSWANAAQAYLKLYRALM